MVKGLQRKHSNHVIKNSTVDYINVVKTALIYGANASGKSNFVKALDFIQDLIVNGTNSNENINRKPYILDDEFIKQASKFTFNFCYNDICYLYGIEFDSNVILKEYLYEVLKTSDKLLFERNWIGNEPSYSFGNWINSLDSENKRFVNFVAKGTRPNQPFLKESVDRQVKQFDNAYTWFKDSLQIIFPSTIFNIGRILFNDEYSGLLKNLIGLLNDFGTGIVDFDLESLDMAQLLPENLIKDIEKGLSSENNLIFAQRNDKEKIFITKDNETNQLNASKLMLKHRGSKGETIQIEPMDESDGTIRLIDLFPILLQSPDQPQVFIVDEFDRSIHPNLSYKFLQLFLDKINSNIQLIVTTHEENLLDLDLLRRDEIWFIEKDYEGASHLYSLEEFQPRYDKDIRKGYLQGRFGAIPLLRSPGFCEDER